MELRQPPVSELPFPRGLSTAAAAAGVALLVPLVMLLIVLLVRGTMEVGVWLFSVLG